MDQKSLGDWAALNQNEYASLSPEEKRKRLFDSQVEVLKRFLERDAITPRQYEKSLHDLCEKMGMTPG